MTNFKRMSMRENDLKIYCKFDKTKPSVDRVISTMFCEYIQIKNIEGNNSQDGQNKLPTLK